PEHWYSALIRCLERDPEQRFATIRDAASAFALPVASSPQLARRKTGWMAAGALAVLCAAGGFALRSFSTHRPPAPAAVSHPLRSSLALLGFTNVSGRADTSYISTALAQGIGSELGSGTRLRIITSEDIARAKVELGLTQTSTLAADVMSRVRRNLGADYVVVGSYTALGSAGSGQLRIDLRLLDAATGQALGWVSRSGGESELLSLIGTVSADVRQKLGVGDEAPAVARASNFSLPASQEARRL